MLGARRASLGRRSSAARSPRLFLAAAPVGYRCGSNLASLASAEGSQPKAMSNRAHVLVQADDLG